MSFKHKVFASILLLSISLTPSYALLRVGTVFFDPPFVMSNGIGFDIQFIRLLCNKLKEECIFVPMNYHKLFDAISDGSIDIAIGGMTIDAGGPTKFIYSIPYVLSRGQFITRKNNGYKTIDDLSGKSVGLIRGSNDGGVFYNFVLKKYSNKFNLVKYNNMEDLITALSNNSIAAAFTHVSTVEYWTTNGGDQFRPLDNKMIVGDGVGIISSPTPKNMLLMQRIDQQINIITQSNAYLNLYNTYIGDQP